MKITVDMDLDVSAKAIFRNDGLSLSVVGLIAYGDRQASTTITDGWSDELYDLFEAAFEQLITEATNRNLVVKAQAGHAECLTAAARMGEV